MRSDYQVKHNVETEFEPSVLVEYGDVREHTRNGGNPANQPLDNNTYTS